MNKKPHFHVAAAVIWRDGRVLIARRPRGCHLEGLWEFPGGKKREAESLRHCLEREIREELGLHVSVHKALCSLEHDYGSKRVSLHFFHCTCKGGEPKALEGQEMRWVKPEELDGYEFPPPDTKMIEELRHGKGSPESDWFCG